MNTALPVEDGREEGGHNAPQPSDSMTALSVRVRAEYREMPGLRLTVRQAARLLGISPAAAGTVLDELRLASVLALSSDGAYSLLAEPSRWRRIASPHASSATE